MGLKAPDQSAKADSARAAGQQNVPAIAAGRAAAGRPAQGQAVPRQAARGRAALARAAAGQAGRRPSYPVRAACLAAAIVAAAVLGAAGPAAAQPARTGLAAGGAGTCAPRQLRVTVPAAIPGDPSEGMGNRAWNILLRHVAGPACSVTGWPRITALRATGRPLSVRFTDVTFSNLGPAPRQRIVLSPGQSAVATVTGAAATPGCVTSWRLRLTLPAGGAPITVSEPAGPFLPCLGGQLRLSPVQRERTLRRAIAALTKPGSPARAHTDLAKAGAHPVVCRLAALRVSVASVARSGSSSLVVLRLRTTSGACVLPEAWPTVRLLASGGARPVAKAMPAAGAFGAAALALTSYARGHGQVTALALRKGTPVAVPVLLPGGGPAGCARARSATIYPSVLALGSGVTVGLPGSLSLCGMPRVLPFVRARHEAQAMRSWALGRTGTQQPNRAPGGWGGWWKGTDSAYPFACGTRAPYREPRGDCSNGTAGYYGAYIGEVGSFQRWQGCGTGLNWLQGNYYAAQATAASNHGLGAAAYWFAAGPGRDPHYNGTTAEAARWGTRQALRVTRVDLGLGYDFPYVFMDIENNGAPPDENGWNTIWNGPCGGSIRGGFISPAVDRATEQAFSSYIYRNTSYYAGVYSAGVQGYGSWGGIFGGGNLSGASEWTFANESASVSTFPRRFSVPGAKAEFFSNEVFGCDLVWQWSGGNGVLNRFGGDLDQIDANHVGLCPGDGPK